MQLNLLHLDDAFVSQPEFMAACEALKATQIDARAEGAPVRLWGKEANLNLLQEKLKTSLARGAADGPVVTFMGSGDFHHVTALLLGLVADASPITIIHFDNHPDWVGFSGGMHCGSWVNRALDLPQVERVITIGVTSRDLVRPQYKGANLAALKSGKIQLLPWRSPGTRFSHLDMGGMGEDAFSERLRSLIKTRNIYITIDKDVLSHKDAVTNWDQGSMPLAYLLHILRFLMNRHHVAGIDVNGDYSRPHYAGRRHSVALKKLEALIDQPRVGKHFAQASAINQATNKAILNCIKEAA